MHRQVCYNRIDLMQKLWWWKFLIKPSDNLVHFCSMFTCMVTCMFTCFKTKKYIMFTCMKNVQWTLFIEHLIYRNICLLMLTRFTWCIANWLSILQSSRTMDSGNEYWNIVFFCKKWIWSKKPPISIIKNYIKN